MSPKPLGRPRTYEWKPRQTLIRWSDDHYNLAKKLGKGNVSLGVRRALDAMKEIENGCEPPRA